MNKVNKQITQIEAALVEPDDGRRLPDIAEFPMIAIAIEHVLKGTNAREIKEVLNNQGWTCGMNRAMSVIRLAKQQIMKMGVGDFAENYAWAQANLLDMHAKAVDDDDTRARALAIKMLIDLWRLQEPPEQANEEEITPEMVEEFEAKLLR